MSTYPATTRAVPGAMPVMPPARRRASRNGDLVMNRVEPSATQQSIRAMLPALAIDLVTPLAVYGALQAAGVSITSSLAGAAAVPLGRIVLGAVRRRRLNGLALIVLGALGVGVALTLATGDPRLAIARDAVITLAVGVVFIGSMAMRRPLMFHVLRSFRGTDIEAQWERLPLLRRDLRAMTAVIGGLCVLDAAVRVLIAYTLPVHTAGTLVHFQPIVLVSLLMLLGKTWGQRIRQYAQAGSTTNPGRGDQAS